MNRKSSLTARLFLTASRANQKPVRGIDLGPLKSVRAPILAAGTVMHKEEAGRIVLIFDCSQPRIILSPVRLLPCFVEIITLRNIRAGFRDDFPELVHCLTDFSGVLTGDGQVGFITGNTRIDQPTTTRDDSESK